MARGKSQNNTPEVLCRFFIKGSCRFGDKCRHLHEVQAQSASSERNEVVSNGALDAHEIPSTSSSPVVTNGSTGDTLVKSIPRLAKPCRGWKAGSCRWGDKCHFRHEIKDNAPPAQFSSPVTTATVLPGASEISVVLETPSNVTPVQVQQRGDVGAATQRGEATRCANEGTLRRAREQKERRNDAVHRAHEATLCRSREQEETARLAKEREEAIRLAREQEEAARREREETARLAMERAAAVRREEQRRLAKEREERERITQRQRQEAEWVKEATVTIQRVIMDSIVKLEAGLTIQHVICGFEASQVMIKNLPLDAKTSEIIELFSQQGIDQADIAIWRTETIGDCQRVRVLGKAAEIETIALGLDGIEFRDKNLEFAVCQRLSGGRTMGSSNHNTYHLNMSWRAPPLTMVAVYYNIDILDIPMKILSLNNRELNGQRVRVCSYPPAAIFGGAFDDSQRSIQISRIPGSTSTADVRAFAGTPHVRILDGDVDAFQTINTHLRSLPNSGLRSFTLENNPKPNFLSAKAIFESWEGAKAAHDSLSGRGLRPDFPRLRLFLSDPHRFVITIEDKQYNAQRSQWVDLCGAKKRETKIQTRTIVDQARGNKVIITLSGSDKKAVGALKVRIESLARGQKLDASYWHPRLASQKGQRHLSDLCEESEAYVRFDWKHRCITVHGTAEAIETAKSRIKGEVERLSAEEWIIPLQRRALGFFIREGLAKMKGLLGEENVTLNVASAQIVLHGADLEEARHYLRQLMDAFATRNAGLTVQSSDDILCPICYDSLSQAVEVSCGHIYCSSCLRHYVHSALDNRSFPLKCMGNDATCNSPFSIPLIQRFLPPQRFEQLLEAAFVSHIERNPEEFKYCTTPDCTQVYRATASPKELQCPSCFSEICTACHEEGHVGLTCAERRSQKDTVEQDRLNEMWALDNGVKRCPSCRIWLEKTEGCNHMTCKCGKHICWVCMGIFEADEIYTHMSDTHRGYYGAPEPQHNEMQAAPAWPGNEVPDIVQLVGGPDAVAAQMAELRRIELQRVNRGGVFGAPPVAHHIPARNQVQLEADRLRREDERRRQQLYQQALREHEEQERQRGLRAQERMLELQRQERERREAETRRRQLFEQQARQRRTKEEKSWCIIM